MKKIYLIVALMIVSLVGYNQKVFGWGTNGGDGARFTQLQETAVFFNNSGVSLSAGDVVVIDTSGSGVSSGSTLGGYVTTTTSADDTKAIGVVKSLSATDQSPVVVVTRGPVGAHCQNSSGTNPVDGTAVGTFTTAKTCDSGTNLGVAIAGGDQLNWTENNSNLTWIWVQGIGTE